MEHESDGCTGFFQTWIRWKTFYSWELFNLRPLCVEHDNRCGSHGFFKGLRDARAVGGFFIWLVAVVACWIKYPKLMKKKV